MKNCSGPPRAPILILGESWGSREEQDPNHTPFIGSSGWELNKMLSEAGIARDDCFCCNVANINPPGGKIENLFYTKTEGRKNGIPPTFGLFPADIISRGLDDLRTHLTRGAPKLIIALGNTALWAATGGRTRRPDEKSHSPTGILRWRGSELSPPELHESAGWACLPTIHPAAVLREWALRPIVVHDLRRATKLRDHGVLKPAWQFIVRPTFPEVMDFLGEVERRRLQGLPVTCDIETRGGQIACVGIAITRDIAICIPFMCKERRDGYWASNEEITIIFRLKRVLRPLEGKPPFIFQNGAYDLQFFARQFGFLPPITDDTMLMQHTLFPGLRKGLDFLSSMYCEYHRYWKDDGKSWDPSLDTEDKLWSYNCEDCVRTFEVWEELDHLITSFGLRGQYEFQMKLLNVAVKMMLRGTRIDPRAKKQFVENLEKMQTFTEGWINTALGREFNCQSNPQMTDLFYGEMRCKPIKKRTPNGYRLTCDDEALAKIAAREPILRPLTDKIREFRSIKKFRSEYADMKLDVDGRARSSINLAGADTFRWSMGQDAWGFGANLQTIPQGTEKD